MHVGCISESPAKTLAKTRLHGSGERMWRASSPITCAVKSSHSIRSAIHKHLLNRATSTRVVTNWKSRLLHAFVSLASRVDNVDT